MSVYTYYAADLVTGRAITELPLVGFQGGRHLQGGSLSASLVLSHLDRDRRRELLAAVAEGKATVVADRDGVIVGEWIVWRSQANALTNDPIPIMGQEVVSYLSMQPMPAGTFAGTEQLDIAAWMTRDGFWHAQAPGGPGAVAIDIPDPIGSGVLRDRTYTEAEAPVSQRLQELAEVLGGFDVLIDTEWDWSAGYRAVRRTLRLAYPSAGRATTLVFDQAPPTWREGQMQQRSGGSITDMQMDRDGTRLGTAAVAVCAGKGDGRVLGHASSGALLAAGWPSLTQMRSWTTVSTQSVADGHAGALLGISQTPEVPPAVTVLADGDPGLGDYQLGDRVRLHVAETTNLPDGYDATVRVLGWTLQPPAAGVETVALEVTSILPDIGGDA